MLGWEEEIDPGCNQGHRVKNGVGECMQGDIIRTLLRPAWTMIIKNKDTRKELVKWLCKPGNLGSWAPSLEHTLRWKERADSASHPLSTTDTLWCLLPYPIIRI